MAAGPFEDITTECPCEFRNIFGDINQLDSFLSKNMVDLKAQLLVVAQKFKWDFENVWNPRFQFIDTDVQINIKICVNHGIGFQIIVFPKSRDPEEEESLWMCRSVNFLNQKYLLPYAQEKVRNLISDIVDICQKSLMDPNSK